jgi:UDP-GlcNAc3NAcA epimerase
MKIVTVLGARPQFIKAAAVSRVIRDDYAGKIEEILVHTGQHYDHNMSKIFFEDLDIPHPQYNLEISANQHGAMTGRMLESIEKVLLQEKPDWVLIYGDTNSTLAGALAAAKLHIPIAHVEAGLRSFNKKMPEEINRILTDHVSSLLFCPTETAVHHLKAEGIEQGVHNVGDVMYDIALFYCDRAREKSTVMQALGLSHKGFALATCHRAENTDNPKQLCEILCALSDLSKQLPVVLSLHPRTRKLIAEYGLSHHLDPLIVSDPLSFLDMMALEQAAKVIITDSGGVQKEAFFYGVPCITLRDETEWVETLHSGWNQLVGANHQKIIEAASALTFGHSNVFPYGDGTASEKIVRKL